LTAAKRKRTKSADPADPAEAPEAAVEDAPDATPAEPGLQPDDPLTEDSADIVSADPAAGLTAPAELHAALEALLFSSPDPLTVGKLARALGDLPPKTVRDALDELAAEYEAQGRGFRLIEVSGGYQLATDERYAEYVLRLGAKKKPPALSGAMLETLAIIAYRQPVIRAVVESIRGVESSGVVRNLLDLGLIEVVGRKEVLGRPQMYGTTEKFLRTFGLRDLKDLPSIRGLREKLEAEEARAEQAEHEAAEARAADEPGADAPADVAHPLAGDERVATDGEAPARDADETDESPA
jgi:segregation and condensation protein B